MLDDTITLGNFPNNFNFHMEMNSVFYYVGWDHIHGSEVWRTDGTQQGTFLLKDISTPGSSNPDFMCILNNHILFPATTPNEGTELWDFRRNNFRNSNVA
jgi:ELWxxDGT repeat protein